MIKRKKITPTTNETDKELTSDREKETLQAEDVDLTKESDTEKESSIPLQKRMRRMRKTSKPSLLPLYIKYAIISINFLCIKYQFFNGIVLI